MKEQKKKWDHDDRAALVIFVILPAFTVFAIYFQFWD